MKNINRRNFISLLASGTAWAMFSPVCGQSQYSENSSGSVNRALKNQVKIDHIIILSIDTLRADHLACYGHPFIQSPNIDKLAKESILFEQHINSASSTLSSHTSLMTGTYPHTHGVAMNGNIVDKKNIMLAETLRAEGFLTAGFIGAAPLGRSSGFNQGFDKYDTKFDFVVYEKYNEKSQRRAEKVTDAALKWLNKNRTAEVNKNNSKKRYFLFLHYFDPHLPYDAPSHYKNMYQEKGNSFDCSIEAALKDRSILRNRKLPEALKLAKAYDAGYSAEITYCDYHVGRFLQELKKHGIYDNSLIILTSDHGETINEHNNILNHGRSVFDTEIRTPLIIRFPGDKFGNQRVSRIVSNIDIVPTINHLLGLKGNDRIEGQSFASVIDGPLGPRDPVFAEATQPHGPEFSGDPLWPNRKRYQCIRTERYKYMIRTADKKIGFYDLHNDPLEQNNLLKNRKQIDSDLVDSMRKQLERWSADVHPVAAPKQTESEEAINALKSLGYIN